MGVPPQPSSSVRAYPNTMLRALALKAIFFWANKRKVTRAAAADRNARRVGGQIAASLHTSDNNPAATATGRLTFGSPPNPMHPQS